MLMIHNCPDQGGGLVRGQPCDEKEQEPEAEAEDGGCQRGFFCTWKLNTWADFATLPQPAVFVHVFPASACSLGQPLLPLISHQTPFLLQFSRPSPPRSFGPAPTTMFTFALFPLFPSLMPSLFISVLVPLALVWPLSYALMWTHGNWSSQQNRKGL